MNVFNRCGEGSNFYQRRISRIANNFLSIKKELALCVSNLIYFIGLKNAYPVLAPHTGEVLKVANKVTAMGNRSEADGNRSMISEVMNALECTLAQVHAVFYRYMFAECSYI